MQDIAATTPVHLCVVHQGKRWHLYKVENDRRPDGTLYLKGSWDDQLQYSKAFSFQTAKLIQRRLKDESGLEVKITLAADENADFIEGETK